MLTYNLSERGKTPRYYYLYKVIKRDIVTGKLKGDEKMPSKRVLAEHLGISVVTVENTYLHLLAEGYLYSKERSGYYVSKLDRIIPPKPDEKPINEERMPDEQSTNTLFPFSVWAKLTRTVLADYGEKILVSAPANGCFILRKAIADFLYRYRGMNVRADRIIIGSGAEYLYGLIVQLFGRDKIYGVENPSYAKIALVYSANGGECEFLNSDKTGVPTELLNISRADVLHLTPSHNFVSDTVTPAVKRFEYLNWAHKNDKYIVEDDFDSEFRQSGKPLETLYAMDNGQRVIYCNTFSKTIAPSLRIGYLILPENLMMYYKKRFSFYSCTVPVFDQYVLAEFINNGYFERHLTKIKHSLKPTV